MSALPDYNADARCLKCCAGNAWTGLHVAGDSDYLHRCTCHGACPVDYKIEHLDRRCTRCNFRWAEACEDDLTRGAGIQ